MMVWYRQWLAEGDHDSELADGGGLELFDSEEKLYAFLLDEIDQHGIYDGDQCMYDEMLVAYKGKNFEPLREMYQEYWYYSDIGCKELQ